MRILLPTGEIFGQAEIFSLYGRRVGAFRGQFLIESDEMTTIQEVCNFIWNKLPGCKSFVGHVRFDLVPGFPVDSPVLVSESMWDLGPLRIVGIYEVNAHSPECVCACSALRRSFPEITFRQPHPEHRLSRAIKNKFGEEKIIFIRGDGLVKQAWGQYFIDDLIACGLNLEVTRPDEFLTHPDLSPSSVIWRWGDARLLPDKTGGDEFPLWFQKYLLDFPGAVFNTMPRPSNGDLQDISYKGYLKPNREYPEDWNRLVGDNRILRNDDDLEWAISKQQNLIAKPLRGSSGRGVILGRKVTPEEWERFLLSSLVPNTEIGLFEARWLPRIKLNDLEITFDINPAFWADGSSLTYLYTVIRVDMWEKYWERGVINVTQGAGFAGCAIEE